MGNKLYVGNLPFSATDDSLREMFGQAGQVESARIITDRDTGRSKGFGFVEISTFKLLWLLKRISSSPGRLSVRYPLC